MFVLPLFQKLVAVCALAVISEAQVSARHELIPRASAPGAFHSTNWAGAVITDPTAEWNFVSGSFTIPSIAAPTGLRSAYISIWVGIDGYTCNTATLKAGVDIQVTNGVASYFSWSELNPSGYVETTEGIPFSAGDEIQLAVQVTSFVQTSVEDGTQRMSTGHPFPLPAAPNKLCQADAIWGIETWQTGDVRVPFTVEITGALASRGDNLLNVGPGSATVINTVENGVALSSCLTNATAVICSFPQL